MRQNFFQKTCFSQLFVYTHTSATLYIEESRARNIHIFCYLLLFPKKFFSCFLDRKKANAICLNHDFDKIFRISKIVYSTEFTEKTQSCTEINVQRHCECDSTKQSRIPFRHCGFNPQSLCMQEIAGQARNDGFSGLLHSVSNDVQPKFSPCGEVRGGFYQTSKSQIINYIYYKQLKHNILWQ